MNIIKKIFLLIQRIFNKEERKMLETRTRCYNIHEKSDFIQLLKVEKNKKNNKVDTLVCVGDGLGIQKKISY